MRARLTPSRRRSRRGSADADSAPQPPHARVLPARSRIPGSHAFLTAAAMSRVTVDHDFSFVRRPTPPRLDEPSFALTDAFYTETESSSSRSTQCTLLVPVHSSTTTESAACFSHKTWRGPYIAAFTRRTSAWRREKVARALPLVAAHARVARTSGLGGRWRTVRRSVGGRGHRRAQRDRIVQVVVNLLSNAVKFSPPGGMVTIGVARGLPPRDIRTIASGGDVRRARGRK
jgi:hypothetical protein